MAAGRPARQTDSQPGPRRQAARQPASYAGKVLRTGSAASHKLHSMADCRCQLPAASCSWLACAVLWGQASVDVGPHGQHRIRIKMVHAAGRQGRAGRGEGYLSNGYTERCRAPPTLKLPTYSHTLQTRLPAYLMRGLASQGATSTPAAALPEAARTSSTSPVEQSEAQTPPGGLWWPLWWVMVFAEEWVQSTTSTSSPALSLATSHGTYLQKRVAGRRSGGGQAIESGGGRRGQSSACSLCQVPATGCSSTHVGQGMTGVMLLRQEGQHLAAAADGGGCRWRPATELAAAAGGAR